MIPYYNPHFRIRDMFYAFFQTSAEEKITKFFKKHTGKKYILFTSSCRSAIFIAYYSLNNRGKVITSPLTCQSAIDPIVWAGNVPVFADIDLDTLNIDPVKIENILTPEVIAIQVINHGGLRVESEYINKIAKEKKIKIIEDCAQSFGINNNTSHTGFTSDIACYSLIKSGYGLGGGILATNDYQIYERSKSFQNTLPKFSSKVVLYRIVKNFLESKRKYHFFESLYQKLILLREAKTDNNELSIEESKKIFLKRPPLFFKLYFASRKNKMINLQGLRIEKGLLFLNKLRNKGGMMNYQKTDLGNSSFTKLFIYHPGINSEIVIKKFNNQGIEVKHLEQRKDSRIQPRFDKSEIINKSMGIKSCSNYLLVHDHLISSPLTEDMNEQQMDIFIYNLSNYIN